jgi:ADP-ribose pyrophosphatase YjhB (NUDIX family)
MPLRPRLCSQCGARVERRQVDDRERDMCTACGAIFYQNPLPVAGSVVADARREVLMVRRAREPGRDLWCLPVGFAELGESIQEAAVRELREETGLVGEPLRLLDVGSFESDFYGDMLFVTFEMRVLAGEPRAGDDAAEVRFFPLDHLPPLAFPVQAAAMRRFVEANREAWAIEDSFRRLRQDCDEVACPEELLSDELLALLSNQAGEVAGLWLAEVRSNPTTPGYAALDPAGMMARAVEVLQQVGRWLRDGRAGAEVRAYYQRLGQERRSQGVPLFELLSSMTLLRKHIWEFARDRGVWAAPIDAYRALELDRRLVAFFDRAMVHAARGYQGGDRP